MSLFDQIYDKIIESSCVVSENMDNSKEVYGYSLKTYTSKELDLFEVCADVIVEEAEKNKASVSSSAKQKPNETHKIWFSVSDNIKYKELRKDPAFTQNRAWINFYSPALINVGVPSLSYNNGEFYLDFALHLPFVDGKVPESKGWKKHIIAALKFSLTDRFYDYLDSIDPKRHTISPEVKEFLDRRESSIRMIELTDRLPELKGIFESQQSFPFGLPDFIEPGPKAKFKLEDTVKVEDPQKRWRIYQSKKSEEAINKVGEIVGYKYVAGAFSKYAVKLANGNVYGIHSHFLRPLTAGELSTVETIKRLPELEGVL